MAFLSFRSFAGDTLSAVLVRDYDAGRFRFDVPSWPPYASDLPYLFASNMADDGASTGRFVLALPTGFSTQTVVGTRLQVWIMRRAGANITHTEMQAAPVGVLDCVWDGSNLCPVDSVSAAQSLPRIDAAANHAFYAKIAAQTSQTQTTPEVQQANVQAGMGLQGYTPERANTLTDLAFFLDNGYNGDTIQTGLADIAAAAINAEGYSLAAKQSADAAARPGNAMTLASGVVDALVLAVQSGIINEADGQQVLKAITDKIASVDPNLGDLSLSAIASSVKTAMEAGGGTLAAIKAKTDTAQQSGAAVTLPASPPSGYGNGGATPQAIADAVANHAAPGDPQGATIGEAITAAKLSGVSTTQNTATLLTRASEVRLAKLDTVQQSGQAVTLPTPAPAGYAGLTSDQATQLANLNTRITPARAANLDGVAQVGSPMTLSNDGITTFAGYLERPAGLLALINMGVNWLTGMTELITGGIRRFKVSAFPAGLGGGAGGGSVPRFLDINVTSYDMPKKTFWAEGREMLAITVKGEGGDFPTQLVNAGFYIGFTPISQMSPPPSSACIAVTPYPDGHDLEARLFVGSPENVTAATPTKQLAPGSYKVWCIIDCGDAAENIINPVGQITVLA